MFARIENKVKTPSLGILLKYFELSSTFLYILAICETLANVLHILLFVELRQAMVQFLIIFFS